MSEVNISGEGRVSGGDTARRRLRELTSLTGVSTHSQVHSSRAWATPSCHAVNVWSFQTNGYLMPLGNFHSPG